MPRKNKGNRETDNKSELSSSQKELLEKFIFKFLPSTNEKRRYPNNSVNEIHNSLNTVFRKQAGFGISERDVIDTFLKMNYSFRTILEPWSELKLPSTIGFYEQVYLENEQIRKSYLRGIKEHSIHISVSAKDVKEIFLSQKRLPIESANIEKTINPRIILKQEIRTFFGLSSQLQAEDYLPKNVISHLKNRNT